MPSSAISSLNLAYRLTTSTKTPLSPSKIWLTTKLLVSLATLSSSSTTPSRAKYLRDAFEFLESEGVRKVVGDNRDLELEELRWEVVELLGGEDGEQGVWENEWERLRRFVVGEGSDVKYVPLALQPLPTVTHPPLETLV